MRIPRWLTGLLLVWIVGGGTLAVTILLSLLIGPFALALPVWAIGAVHGTITRDRTPTFRFDAVSARH